MSSTASSGEVKNAKSLLFVPANRPDRFAKALQSEASAIIIDLEDAVAEDCKDSARAQLVTYLPLLNADQLMRTAVRVNAVDSRFHTDDISALRELAACGVTLMLPKSESAVAIAQVAQQLGPQGQIVALVESLAGLDALDLLARAPQVVRLAFGHLDFERGQAFKLPRLLLIRLSPPTQLVAQHLDLPRNRIDIHHVLNVREIVF